MFYFGILITTSIIFIINYICIRTVAWWTNISQFNEIFWSFLNPFYFCYLQTLLFLDFLKSHILLFTYLIVYFIYFNNNFSFFCLGWIFIFPLMLITIGNWKEIYKTDIKTWNLLSGKLKIASFCKNYPWAIAKLFLSLTCIRIGIGFQDIMPYAVANNT